MCGIAGLFCYAEDLPVDEAVGLRMTEAVQHRGPDDGGLLVGPGVLLGHRRLSVIDPSDNGHQPMSDSSGRFWIVYNGEVYNYREIRGELESKGQTFRSGTDTEVILGAFREWGSNAFARFNGMFALSIWDAMRRELWLVRDPVGIKPLYYFDDGRRLRFASEIKGILADADVPRTADLEALDAFLTFSYTPAPRSGFAGIRQLLPGQCLHATAGGCRLFSCCTLPLPDGYEPWTEGDAVQQLRATIDGAVGRQLVSDVPLGALLSGGLDSSAVVRAMQAQGGRQTLTFSIGFGDPSFDESPYAQRVADILGTRHHTRHVAADAFELLPRLVSHAEEPFADNSMIPFFHLAQFTRERVTVALSGDGADELLAGYSTYLASRLARWYRRIPGQIRRRAIAPMIRRIRPSTTKYAWSMLLRRFVEGSELPAPRDHCSWRQILSPEKKKLLYTPRMQQAVQSFDALADYVTAVEKLPAWASELDRLLYADLTFHLPNDMLVKVDRMSMAHSLEVRVPLLDLEMIRCCFAIPSSLKLRGRSGKYVLRQAMSDSLPRNLVRRRKAGFVAPIESWLRGPWQPLLRELLDEKFLRSTEIFEVEPVQQMIHAHGEGRHDHAYELFAILILSLWWRIWIDRSLPTACVTRRVAPIVVHRVQPLGSTA